METLTPQLDHQKLRAAREKAGLTQMEMARLLHVGKSQISNIESGRSLLDANDLAIWCRACGIGNPMDLFTSTPPCHLAKKFNKIVQKA